MDSIAYLPIAFLKIDLQMGVSSSTGLIDLQLRAVPAAQYGKGQWIDETNYHRVPLRRITDLYRATHMASSPDLKATYSERLLIQSITGNFYALFSVEITLAFLLKDEALIDQVFERWDNTMERFEVDRDPRKVAEAKIKEEMPFLFSLLRAFPSNHSFGFVSDAEADKNKIQNRQRLLMMAEPNLGGFMNDVDDTVIKQFFRVVSEMHSSLYEGQEEGVVLQVIFHKVNQVLAPQFFGNPAFIKIGLQALLQGDQSVCERHMPSFLQICKSPYIAVIQDKLAELAMIRSIDCFHLVRSDFDGDIMEALEEKVIHSFAGQIIPAINQERGYELFEARVQSLKREALSLRKVAMEATQTELRCIMIEYLIFALTQFVETNHFGWLAVARDLFSELKIPHQEIDAFLHAERVLPCVYGISGQVAHLAHILSPRWPNGAPVTIVFHLDEKSKTSVMQIILAIKKYALQERGVATEEVRRDAALPEAKGFSYQMAYNGVPCGVLIGSCHTLEAHRFSFHEKIAKAFAEADLFMVEQDPLKRQGINWDEKAIRHSFLRDVVQDTRTKNVVLMDLFLLIKAYNERKQIFEADDPKIRETLMEVLQKQSDVAKARGPLHKRSFEEEMAILERQTTVYQTGDIEGTCQYVLDRRELDEADFQERLHHMHGERNPAQAKNIAAMIQSNPGKKALVVIGAAHLYDLPGIKGVISLLEERGFTFTRV